MNEKLSGAAAKTEGWLESHPRITLALAGAAFALVSLEFFEGARMFLKVFRAAHIAEFAADEARAASEALGG